MNKKYYFNYAIYNYKKNYKTIKSFRKIKKQFKKDSPKILLKWLTILIQFIENHSPDHSPEKTDKNIKTA